MLTALAVNCESMIKVLIYISRVKIIPLFMSLATPNNKSISNHAKILLREMKYMKIDRRKNAKTDDNLKSI